MLMWFAVDKARPSRPKRYIT